MRRAETPAIVWLLIGFYLAFISPGGRPERFEKEDFYRVR